MFDEPGTFEYVCTLHSREATADRPVSVSLRRDVVIVACAISAGIHGALSRLHFDEGVGAGLGFAAATVLLTALVVGLTLGPRARGARGRGGGSPARPARELRPRRHDRRARAPPTAGAGRRPRARDQDRGGRPPRRHEPAPAAVGRPASSTERNLTWTRRTARPILLALTALVAFFSALAALAVSNGHDAHAHGTAPAALTQKQVVAPPGDAAPVGRPITWTRLAIISLTTKSPDTQATVARPSRTRATSATPSSPSTGGRRQPIDERAAPAHPIAADVVAAAQAGDAAKLDDARHAGPRTPTSSPRVLASANPRFWKLAAMKAALRTHLRLTAEEAVARLRRADWEADVAAYDKIHCHALHLSDLLANGLIKQFPRRFR